MEFKDNVNAAEFQKVWTMMNLLSKGRSNVLESDNTLCKVTFMHRIRQLEEQVKSLQNENKSLEIVNEMLQQEIIRIQAERSITMKISTLLSLVT